MKIIKFFYLLVFFLLFSCKKVETVEPGTDPGDEFLSEYPVQAKSYNPLSLIKKVTVKTEKNRPINFFTLSNKFPENWVGSDDVEQLMSLVESKEKCNCLMSPLSSTVPNEDADVGGYALYFINSFRKKETIDFGLSICPKTTEKEVLEIKKWWAEYKSHN